jgi:RNA polymerase sigma-70 factor, ECF subfamily
MANSLAVLADVTVGTSTAARYGDATERSRDENMELVYQLHSKPLHRFLLRLTFGDRRDAEDLLQETLLKAWVYFEDHQFGAETLRPWLFTVARRLAIDAARARRSRPNEVILENASMLPAVNEADRLLVSLEVRRRLASLSAEHRRVLVEVFYLGRSMREAGESIGIPEGTVKSRIYYAIRALRAGCDGRMEAA